jgi:hypothetical protein
MPDARQVSHSQSMGRPLFNTAMHMNLSKLMNLIATTGTTALMSVMLYATLNSSNLSVTMYNC